MKKLINGFVTNSEEFAYDGCHKIYIIEDANDKKDALECGYQILPIKKIKSTFLKSCGLRFINTWKLQSVVSQGEVKSSVSFSL